jgi:soluble lytic murein transglycosylase-like protein
VKRFTTILLAVATVLPLCAGSALADIYMRRGADGGLQYTDTPTTMDGYKLIVRESPETLPWREYAHIQARRHDLDPKLVRALIYVESAENPVAVSNRGALGLMQLMPETAEELGVHDPLMPMDNVRGGVEYFSQMLRRFDGDVELALAAYNAGPGAVEKFGGIPPYPETINFVKKVLNLYKRVVIDDG